ncbi:MAG: hypothetical protein OEV37_00565 [Candidatus Berkelbacteria bacterium]|nr:hypothetical protein [Candidatus Berkelbacteria bacterium]
MIKRANKIDLIILLLWPIIASAISLVYEPGALVSVILYLFLPSLYLSIRYPRFIKMALLFSAISSIPTMIVIDYIAQTTNAWLMYPNSVFPFKLFSIVTIEVVLWAFFSLYLIVIFYEAFVNEHIAKKLWKPQIKYYLWIVISVFIFFLFIKYLTPELLNIPYYYLAWGTVLLLIPFIIQAFKFPETTAKIVITGLYFFYLHFIYEIVAMKLGWWTFPGTEFIGWVEIVQIRFPVEELIFWFIFLALGSLTYFEYFFDNEAKFEKNGAK